jgi:hypothetical protein
MKARTFALPLLIAGITLNASTAKADDDLAGALVLGGTGAVIGHAIGGSDGAVIGGFLGAILGAAAADNDNHHSRYRDRRDYRPPVYYVDPPGRPRWREDWRDHDRRDWDDRRWRDERRWDDDGWRGPGSNDGWHHRR